MKIPTSNSDGLTLSSRPSPFRAAGHGFDHESLIGFFWAVQVLNSGFTMHVTASNVRILTYLFFATAPCTCNALIPSSSTTAVAPYSNPSREIQLRCSLLSYEQGLVAIYVLIFHPDVNTYNYPGPPPRDSEKSRRICQAN